MTGVLFGYFVVLPSALHFFKNFNSGQFNVLATDIFKLVIGQQDFPKGAVVAIILLVAAVKLDQVLVRVVQVARAGRQLLGECFDEIRVERLSRRRECKDGLETIGQLRQPIDRRSHPGQDAHQPFAGSGREIADDLATRAQVRAHGLDDLSVRTVSDRHLLVTGRLPAR